MRPVAERCRAQNLPCLFDTKPPVQLDDAGMGRLEAMESTLDGLSGRVDQILALLGEQTAFTPSVAATRGAATAGGGGGSSNNSNYHNSSGMQNSLLSFDAITPQSFATPPEAAAAAASQHHQPGPEPPQAHLNTPCIHENQLHAPVEALNKASAETAPGFVTRSPSPELADAAQLLGNLAHASSSSSPHHLHASRPSKRRRTTYELALASVKEEGSHGRQDLVSRGILSERVARELFNTFLTHCLPFAPFLNPSSDTFEDLRDHSPLCFNAVMTVTARAEKLPPEKGSLNQIMNHTLSMARNCVFAPSFTISDIQ